MLEVQGLACERGPRRLFAGLSFTLGAGELLQVQGRNGAGKTSLLRLLAGLLPPAAGEVRWAGRRREDDLDAFRAALLFIGHAAGLKEDLSALENLQLNAGLAGEPVERREALQALAAWGLASRALWPCRVLSQGLRRRVALARLSLTRRPLWLLDEPLAALDGDALGLLDAQLGQHLDRGGLVLLSSHQPLLQVGQRARTLVLDGGAVGGASAPNRPEALA